MNKIIEDYKKIVAGNEAGKNICFMSRGEYADPKIAYNGILMNYWDVYNFYGCSPGAKFVWMR